MLALFRFFLASLLGAGPTVADRLTDLQAWSNPIAQARLLAQPMPGPKPAALPGAGLRSARAEPSARTGAGVRPHASGRSRTPRS